MAELLLIAFAAFFLFGLVQWARGGALLWDIIKFRKGKPMVSRDSEASDEESLKTEAREGEALRELESMTDSLLRSSFRVLGILALCVWLFVIASVVFDILGLDWMDRLSFQTNRLWGDPSVRSGAYGPRRNTPGRNNVIRSLGSGLR